MKIYTMDQRSDEWRYARMGIPTASEVKRIITPTGKPSSKAYVYRNEKIYERVFRRPWVRYISNLAAVQEGIRLEPFAADKFAQEYDVKLETIGFVTDDAGLYGASPDRLIKGTNEIVEIKCPMPHTLIGYIVDGIETEYYAQMQMQMMIGSWDCCHFYGYHPEIAPFYKRVERDIAFQHKLAAMLREFVHDVIRGEAIVRQHGVFPREDAQSSNFPPEEEDEEVA